VNPIVGIRFGVFFAKHIFLSSCNYKLLRENELATKKGSAERSTEPRNSSRNLQSVSRTVVGVEIMMPTQQPLWHKPWLLLPG
jgi:hypothetical protein